MFPAMSGYRCQKPAVKIPAGELFLTGSSVETHRLIRSRWNEFALEQRQQILNRIIEGPPRDWFREGADVDRAVDRTRFDLLSDMINNHLVICDAASGVLAEIQQRRPEWRPKPSEQAGFGIWHSTGFRKPADIEPLKDVPDAELVAEAQRLLANADFLDADVWQALCLAEPDRALRGLDAAAAANNWPESFWRQLIWSHVPYVDPGTENRVAQLLLRCPRDIFAKLADAASVWLDDHSRALSEELLWPLWDRIASEVLNATGDK